MGYKLGTMVKLFNSLVIFFLVFSVNADPLGQIEKNLNLKQIKPFTDVEAQIYSIRASKDDLSKKSLNLSNYLPLKSFQNGQDLLHKSWASSTYLEVSFWHSSKICL